MEGKSDWQAAALPESFCFNSARFTWWEGKELLNLTFVFVILFLALFGWMVTCEWGSGVDSKYLSQFLSTSFFKTECPTKPGARQSVRVGWLAREPQGHLVPASGALELQACTTTQGLGIELWSLCLCGRHFTQQATSSAPWSQRFDFGFVKSVSLSRSSR